MKLSRFAAGMFAFAGLSGLLAVALAALAAHALAAIAPTGDQAVVWFREATAFQMTHTLALVLITLVSERVLPGMGQRVLRIAAGFMAAAVILFPGALYSASFNGPVIFAPFGGVSAMAGWALFGLGAWLASRENSEGEA
ncbi:MAG: DUF423 domain-containing protein [Rhodospirillaceae bacterium]|nr:DUF423 domain-containing protein [Rhodospirillaceae bacterium]